MNRLSYRLNQVYNLVDFTIGDFLDIGSDHGQLVIELYKNSYPFKLYASENKIGPFNRLKKEINKVNYPINALFGDGLDIYQKNIKQVCISGMGGNTIYEIFNKHKEYLNNIEKIVLQVQNDVSIVRKYLYENNFVPEKEYYFIDNEHIYSVMQLKKGSSFLYTEDDIEYGFLPLKNKDEVLLSYLKKQLSFYKERLKETINVKNLQIKIDKIERILTNEKPH